MPTTVQKLAMPLKGMQRESGMGGEGEGMIGKEGRSWLVCCLFFSKYTLYHPTDGKPRPGGCKILLHKYAAKLINQKKFLPPPP